MILIGFVVAVLIIWLICAIIWGLIKLFIKLLPVFLVLIVIGIACAAVV